MVYHHLGHCFRTIPWKPRASAPFIVLRCFFGLCSPYNTHVFLQRFPKGNVIFLMPSCSKTTLVQKHKQQQRKNKSKAKQQRVGELLEQSCVREEPVFLPYSLHPERGLASNSEHLTQCLAQPGTMWSELSFRKQLYELWTTDWRKRGCGQEDNLSKRLPSSR